MNERISDPVRGEDILPWAKSVTDICRRAGASGSGRLLVREGHGGVGFEPLPENKRGRTAAPVSVPGCYAIDTKSVTKPEEGSEDPAKISATFKNLYYRVGGKTFEGTVEEIANIELPVIVALCIDARSNLPSDSLVLPATMSELQTYEADERYYTIPLYKFDANGNVECDFRIGPAAAMWEFSS